MRYKFLCFLTLFSILSELQAQSDPAAELARKIADKMRDTLVLTNAQHGQIYGINMRLHQQKTQARGQYNTDRIALTKSLQRVENTRDSLYRPVLTEQQYRLYKEKKRNLVNNN